ncbi:hypothetical protein BpHYR1_003475 [Brachionus plicatilis]|uniref:Uncharacterized protein n=1 Tax=Brachionus plicatilis TaxID=10195 RepID=A0A3M7T0Z5_BRAPC|nr:hypothetical protein BpHYR1_003475 [Brachionus plicatilis]
MDEEELELVNLQPDGFRWISSGENARAFGLSWLSRVRTISGLDVSVQSLRLSSLGLIRDLRLSTIQLCGDSPWFILKLCKYVISILDFKLWCYDLSSLDFLRHYLPVYLLNLKRRQSFFQIFYVETNKDSSFLKKYGLYFNLKLKTNYIF